MTRPILTIFALLFLAACVPRINAPIGPLIAEPTIPPEEAERINRVVRTRAYGMVFDQQYGWMLRSFACTEAEVATIRGMYMTFLGAREPGARPITLDAINSLSPRCQQGFNNIVQASEIRRIADARAARELSELN